MDFPNIILTDTPDATERAGASVAEALADNSTLPRFVALYGDLGTGKTAFTRGLIHFFIPQATVKSPTFALLNEYGVKNSRISKILHFDMYRIGGEEDLYSTGFYDFLEERGGLIVAEWCEKIPFALPESIIRVKIEKPDLKRPGLRKITIEKAGET